MSKEDYSKIKIGDTISVHLRIKEGQRSRVQIYKGIVISMKRKKGAIGSLSVYRNAYGCSMERVFLLNSPSIEKISIDKLGKVKRAKLYYLRGASGKAAKVKEQIFKNPNKKQKKESE